MKTENKTLEGGFYVTKNDALLFVCGDDKVIFAACNAWDNEHKGTLVLGLAGNETCHRQDGIGVQFPCSGKEKLVADINGLMNGTLKTLYEDKNISLEQGEGIYRITFFKDCHWAGDVVLNSEGIIAQDLKENENKTSKENNPR